MIIPPQQHGLTNGVWDLANQWQTSRLFGETYLNTVIVFAFIVEQKLHTSALRKMF